VAFTHTARAVPVGAVLTLATLAAAPTVVTVVRGGTDLSVALVVAAVIGGAAFAFAIDDDAAVVLASSPTTLTRRRAARLGAALLAVGAGWELVLATAESADALNGVRVGDLGVEAFTAAGVALAAAAVAARSGSHERTGITGIVTAVLTMLTTTAMAQQYRWLPQLGRAAHHDRWLWVATVAWTLALWASRDPASRY
jgi:hypothetical protein